MSKPYKSKHKPPTPYEREVLTIMQEECAEIIVAISKALRFGLMDGYPGGSETNLDAISRELGDLNYVISMAHRAGLTDTAILCASAQEKGERLKIYMQTKPDAKP